MHIFGIPRVHRVLLCIWFLLTPAVLTLDLVKRRRGLDNCPTMLLPFFRKRMSGQRSISIIIVGSHSHTSSINGPTAIIAREERRSTKLLLIFFFRHSLMPALYTSRYVLCLLRILFLFGNIAEQSRTYTSYVSCFVFMSTKGSVQPDGQPNI